MEQVIVVNKRAGGPRGFTVHYIGRPSVLGNPYPVGGEIQRGQAVGMFKEFLREDWKRNGPMRKALEDLAERVRDGECIALECWCKPAACHGDVIKEAIEGINRRHIERILAEQQRHAVTGDGGHD